MSKATLTVREAAEHLGIGLSSAYEAVRTNAIPHLRLGRRIVISKVALAKLTGSEIQVFESTRVGDA